jgi:hypothetical protein
MAIEPDYTLQGGVWFNGAWEWRLHDQLHRVDGPARIWASGTQWWCLHGELHRVDGPALIYPDGHCEWYQHGKIHRVAGPAVIYPSGIQYWYVYGRNITKEVEAWMQANTVTSPFTESQQMEFVLRWL